MHKTNVVQKANTRGLYIWIKTKLCQNPNLKIFGLSPLPMQKIPFIFGYTLFIYEPIFKISAAHFRQKEY